MSTEQQILITGARIYTADPWHPWATALLVQGDRIRAVGSDAEVRPLAGPQAEHYHLAGALVVPGFNDSHIHTDWGGHALQMLDLSGVQDVAMLQRRLADYARAQPRRAWIEGTGLGYEALLDVPEPRRVLDEAVPDRPVYLRALDWHTSWANSRALEQAGILHGAELAPPNEVVVDAEGLATGMLKERMAFTLVEACIPARSEAEEDDSLAAAFRYLNSFGITSVQNMHGDPAVYARYQRLHETGRQTVRALHYMRVREDTPAGLIEETAVLTRASKHRWNRVGGIKMFMDGVVESKTAMLLAPYSDGSGERGVPDMDPEAHRRFAVHADALGLQVATHAIGDRAVRCTLDSYEAAASANGTPLRHRHRVEHIEVLDPHDLQRFAALGVVVSMQPLHCAPTTDPYQSPYAALLGPERVSTGFAWRSLLETGASLSFGSDWPIVTPDVLQGMHVALTRTTVSGEPRGGYEPQQCLTLAQTLDAYTRGAAYAEFQEQHKGVLREGMLADVTVLSHDLFRHGAEAILDTKVVLTILNGQVVYQNSAAATS